MKRKIVIGLIAIIAIVAMAMFSGCVEEEAPVKAADTTPLEETPIPIQETATESKKPSATPTPTPTDLSLKVGETAKTSKVEVTIKSVEKTDCYEYYSDILNEYRTECVPEGKIFFIAEVEIKNIGSDKAYVGSTAFSAMDAEGYRYDPELYLGEDGLDMFQELYQNQKMGGKLLFKVLENAEGLKIQYDFGSLFTSVKLASWEIE